MNNRQQTSLSNSTPNSNISLNNYEKKCLYQQQLFRNFIEYVRQTGDCHYQQILQKNIENYLDSFNDTTENNLQSMMNKVAQLNNLETESNADYTDNENQEELTNCPVTNQSSSDSQSVNKAIEETQESISQICLNLKEILRAFGDKFHWKTSQENLRNSLEKIQKTTEKPYLFTALKTETQKLIYRLDMILNLAKECQNESMKRLIKDLKYYREYVFYHAQATKIQDDLAQVSDSFLYFRRLNQYLDLIPETTISLIEIMQKVIKNSPKNKN